MFFQNQNRKFKFFWDYLVFILFWSCKKASIAKLMYRKVKSSSSLRPIMTNHYLHLVSARFAYTWTTVSYPWYVSLQNWTSFSHKMTLRQYYLCPRNRAICTTESNSNYIGNLFLLNKEEGVRKGIDKTGSKSGSWRVLFKSWNVIFGTLFTTLYLQSLFSASIWAGSILWLHV